VANYNVDIVVGIKGRQQLDKLTKGIDNTLKSVNRLNESARKFNKVTQSVNSYQTALQKANEALNGAVLGSQNETLAVRQFVNALGLSNSARERQNKLIQDQIRLNKNNFAAFSKSASGLGIANDPVSKSIRRNQRNQARRANAANRLRGQSSPLTSPIFPGFSEPIFPGEAQSLFAGGTFRRNLMSNLDMSRTARQASNFGLGFAGDPIAKSIRRNKEKQFRDFLKEKKANKEIRDIKAKQLKLERAQNRALKERVVTTQKLAKTTKTAGGSAAQGQGFFRGGARGAIGSAAIGGGFPLLFGQGALGAIGGGVGGALGGAIGGQFGFSLSIIGTVIAQRIQEAIDFRKEIEKVNVAIERTGGTSRLTATDITFLAKNMKVTKEEALQAANAFAAFGAQSSLALAETFRDRSTFNLYANLNKDAQTFITTVDTLFQKNELGIEQAKESLEILEQRGLKEASIFAEAIKNEKTIRKELEAVKPSKEDVANARALTLAIFDPETLTHTKEFMMMSEKAREATLKLTTAEGQLENRLGTVEERFQKRLAVVKENIRAQRDFNESVERALIMQAPKDELNKLLDPLMQVDALSKSIGASFSESFKGIVRGSMTAQDALRNLFNRTADHFLDMAAQILAAQIRSGIMGLFGNMFGNNFTRSAVSATPTLTPTQQVSRFTFGRANGGTVRRGQPYIVGERGAEMFIPDAGGRIIANHNLGGMGGSTNIVVNVDASGSNVEGDEDEGRALGIALSAAIETELIKQKRPGGLLA
jgi:hypothetical protein